MSKAIGKAAELQVETVAPRDLGFGGRFVSPSPLLLMGVNPLGWASRRTTMGLEQPLTPPLLVVAIDAGPWEGDA